MAAKPKYVVVKKLNNGMTKLEPNQEYHFMFKAPIRRGQTVINARGLPEKSADVALVVDLDTGKDTSIVINATLGSSLNENFPNDGYVGKSFAITCTGQVAGKRYKGFEVNEISIDTKG